MRIVFIGGGNMATALVGGLLARGRAASEVGVVEPFEAQRDRLRQRFPDIALHAGADGAALAGAAMIVLAVKPQQMREACASLAPHVGAQPAVLSVAAGIRLADLSRWLGGHPRIVRAMPNTPGLIGAGIAGLYAPAEVDAPARALASSVLEAAGEIAWFEDESMLDAVTGVSASGPAYVFYFIEALERAARELGFGAGEARRFALATFEGAVKLAKASGADPAELRAQVTSKGGTTARGIATLEGHGVAQAIVACAKAATERARELGDEFGRDG